MVMENKIYFFYYLFSMGENRLALWLFGVSKCQELIKAEKFKSFCPYQINITRDAIYEKFC